jgi:hypothetical protein
MMGCQGRAKAERAAQVADATLALPQQLYYAHARGLGDCSQRRERLRRLIVHRAILMHIITTGVCSTAEQARDGAAPMCAGVMYLPRAAQADDMALIFPYRARHRRIERGGAEFVLG